MEVKQIIDDALALRSSYSL